MILLIGSQGSMGARYASILRYLGKSFVGIDKETSEKKRMELAKYSDGIIIATPTETHQYLIDEMIPAKKPILCEKPVVRNPDILRGLLKRMGDAKVPFRMMFQYSMLTNPNRIGKSRYDYFRHGTDGLVWDCLQIIALARGECRLREDSPIWSCMINGQRLNIADMDAAYIGYVQEWFKKPGQDPGLIQSIHDKVQSVLELQNTAKDVGANS
jgi:hypothetical protein